MAPTHNHCTNHLWSSPWRSWHHDDFIVKTTWVTSYKLIQYIALWYCAIIKWVMMARHAWSHHHYHCLSWASLISSNNKPLMSWPNLNQPLVLAAKSFWATTVHLVVDTDACTRLLRMNSWVLIAENGEYWPMLILDRSSRFLIWFLHWGYKSNSCPPKNNSWYRLRRSVAILLMSSYETNWWPRFSRFIIHCCLSCQSPQGVSPVAPCRRTSSCWLV